MPLPPKTLLSIPKEVNESVQIAVAQFWMQEPQARMIERWAGKSFPNDSENDELTKFLRVCRDAYLQKNKSFFIELGKAMKRKPASQPIVKSSGTFNNLETWLLLGWVGPEFVESVLKRFGAREGDLKSLSEFSQIFTQLELIPFCFYSVAAVCQLRNEVLRLEPQISQVNLKKTCQRLGLKRPSPVPLVKRVEVDATGKITQYLKKRDSF